MGGPAAIHDEACASDERGRRRGEIDNRTHDVLQLPETSACNLGQDTVLEGLIFKEWTGQRRFNKGGSNRVDTNAMGGELHAHGLGKPFDGVLRHAVDGAIGRPHVPHLRGHVDDDAALATVDHLARCRLGDDEHGLHIQGEQEIQMVLTDGEKGLRNVTASVVDQDIEALQAPNALVYLCGIRHIAHQWPRATSFLMDERCHSLQIARGPAYQDDFGARCREGKGARPAQSPTSTRDDGYFPVQPHARHLEWRIVVLPHTSSSRHGAARSCLAYCIKSPGWRYAWKKPESSIRCLC